LASHPETSETWWRELLEFTAHARARMQQRSVPEWVVESVIAHGDLRHVGFGDVSYSFTARAWRRLAECNPMLAQQLERWRNVYVVLTAEGEVRTVARRRRGPDHARRRPGAP
jgi:ribosomal protein L39E